MGCRYYWSNCNQFYFAGDYVGFPPEQVKFGDSNFFTLILWLAFVHGYIQGHDHLMRYAVERCRVLLSAARRIRLPTPL